MSVNDSFVTFTKGFVPAPSCTPCRSSILSGRYFWQTGRAAILQGAVWDSSIPTFPLILEENGYHIGYTSVVTRNASRRTVRRFFSLKGFEELGNR